MAKPKSKQIIQVFLSGDETAEISDYLVNYSVGPDLVTITTVDFEGDQTTQVIPIRSLRFMRIFKESEND